jgi:hypothetical protein
MCIVYASINMPLLGENAIPYLESEAGTYIYIIRLKWIHIYAYLCIYVYYISICESVVTRRKCYPIIRIRGWCLYTYVYIYTYKRLYTYICVYT